MIEGYIHPCANILSTRCLYPIRILLNILDNQGWFRIFCPLQFDLKVNVNGGGINGQTEAIRLAISRALVVLNEENRVALKPDSLLTRDPRMVERKKPGQKKARKKFQFSKR